MRILHTADLHLGRQFNGISLDDDQAEVLRQIVEALQVHDADVLIIAGDIYDRAAPPAGAVRQFNAFLARVVQETRAAVVMISGNHDSADRISSMWSVPDVRRALIRGTVSDDEQALVLEDQYGSVAFTALPFSYEYAARECFADEGISTPEDVLRAQVAAARRNVPDDARWIVVAHAFVAGGSVSESERSLVRVGGVETVSPEIFAGAHYVALGHLHRPQAVGVPHIRYSGSPLAFGFDEAGAAKSMSLVDIDGAGQVTITELPFRPLRGVRSLKGKHAELLLAEPSDDFVRIVLTDDAPVIDGMKRLRVNFPNACELRYERDQHAPEIKALGEGRLAVTEPMDVIADFLAFVRVDAMTDAEREIAARALDNLRQAEEVA